MTEYLKVQSTMNKCNNVTKLLTSHVERICYAYHMELQSKDTPWSVEHQDETPMVSAGPNDCPDLVAPDLTALLETHIDSNMFHHSFKNKHRWRSLCLERKPTYLELLWLESVHSDHYKNW